MLVAWQDPGPFLGGRGFCFWHPGNLRRRESRHVSSEMQSAAPFRQQFRPRDRTGLQRIFAFDEHRRADDPNQAQEFPLFLEYQHTVNERQILQCPVADPQGIDRSERSLQAADRRVRVDRDNQRIALSTGFPEEGDVPRMESVKASICEHDSHNSSQ